MSEPELDQDDPELKKLKPQVSRNAMIAAVIAGALFGLGLAIASFMFNERMPRFGASARPDAGPAELPEVVDLDAGAGSPSGDSPWLE